jgi:hypothetical protein
MRPLALLLLAVAAWAGEAASFVMVFDETIGGKPSQAADRAQAEAIAAYHRDRLARARAELPALPSALAHFLRADIGATEAELERLAVTAGGTLRVGRRVVTLTPESVVVEAEGTRTEVARATGAGTSRTAASAEPQALAMAAPPTPLPASRGRPGPPILGRQTLLFTVATGGRDYAILVDPTLANPFAHLVPREGSDDPLIGELARMPGAVLEIAHDGGEFVRRLTCVELR